VQGVATFKIGADDESIRNAAERFLDAQEEQVDSIVKNVLEGSLRSIVGTLTVGGGHADAQLGFRAAAEHYDSVGAAVARVRAGEDEYGIWVAGWMIPEADPVRRDQFMSSPVSGDWRSIGGSLEMIAVCAVNTPGFPVPRARVAFSAGAQRTLVGTFGITPVKGAAPHVHDIGNPDDDGGVMDDYDNCRDVNCPGPTNTITDDSDAMWAWANRRR